VAESGDRGADAGHPRESRAVAAAVSDRGVAALEHDAPRPGRPRTITAADVRRVVHLTTQEPPPALEYAHHGRGLGPQ
jgi:hypothetical protein